MAMVCGLDLHRRQITFDTVEVESGEEWRGRIWQPDRARVRRWLREDVARRANGAVALAVEGCTGWRYVVEEITTAGFEAHVAEPADTQAARGRKHRAKTDRTDARLLRDLLVAGELPESWIPPEPVLEWRERVRLYKSLVDQRTVWCQRIHAELYQHGVAVPEGAIRSDKTRGMVADPHLRLSPAARERIEVGYRMIDLTDTDAKPLKQALTRFGTRQPARAARASRRLTQGGSPRAGQRTAHLLRGPRHLVRRSAHPHDRTARHHDGTTSHWPELRGRSRSRRTALLLPGH
jgi:transposase